MAAVRSEKVVMRGLFKRVTLIVLDSVGIGPLPDAAAYGDDARDTLGHVTERRGLHLPNLVGLGLANIRALAGLDPATTPRGAYGKAALLSPGKDTTTGHWEMAGIILDHAFPTYPQGFPPAVIARFEQAIGRETLGNIAASGTEIINRLGEEHVKTGRPIVYTSADSVFQIAAHEEVIPVEELYRMCRIARGLLQGEHNVARVIARPFRGQPGGFYRTERRHDFSLEPPYPTLLDVLKESCLEVISVGKIADIFVNRGITAALPGSNNRQALESTLQALRSPFRGLLFANLVDFDTLYGHRLDVEGYARALEEVDGLLPRLVESLNEHDMLILTADHGCDPTGPSTDHSREYVPLLVTGPRVRAGANLGTRATLADIGQTIADKFGLHLPQGISFLPEIMME